MTNPETTHWAALPVLLAGAFVVVLDFFIVNVALPSIAAELGAGEGSLEWVVAGYGLTFAAFLITAGRLGDDFGRRRVYAVGLGAFTIASLACGLAPSPAALVAARLAQGVAGAVVMPQVLAIVGVVYRGPDYVRALSVYGVVLGLAAVAGQVIGGALVQSDIAGLGWRWCFLINVPVGVAGMALSKRLVPESRAPRRARPDFAGSALVAVALTAVLVPLIEGRSHGWPLWTWASLAAAPLLLAAFIAHQRRTAEPLLDLSLFRDRSFSAGLLAQLCLASAQAAFFVYLAFYLQLGRGLTPLQSGLVFTVVAVGYVAVSGPAPQLTARYGRTVVAAGGATLAAGLGLLATEVASDAPLALLVPGLALAGIGVGLCYTPLTSIVVGRVNPERASAATGTMSTVQQVGYALGVAVTGVIFFAPGREVAGAFEVSLLELGVVSLGIVAASRLLPATPRATRAREAVMTTSSV
jgi:EmrB/QacA subfamily drug resistance transporter